MASKRASPDSEQSSGGGREESPPSNKRIRLCTFDPVRIPSVSSVADLDLHTLAFQNKKLSERLQKKSRVEANLRGKIEQLEKRQSQDDALLCVVNRYWNRLDEDVRLLLQRFDAETALETETQKESSATTSFLTLLSQWDKDEIDEKLAQRVEFSKRAIAKLVQAFDRISQRNESISKLVTDLRAEETDVNVKEDPESPKEPTEDGGKAEANGKTGKLALLNEEVSKKNEELTAENKRVQEVMTKLQKENHKVSIELAGCDDKLTEAETKTEEMQNKVEDLAFEIEKGLQREEKLDRRLAEVAKELQSCQLELSQMNQSAAGKSKDELAQVSRNKLDEIQAGEEEQRELAANRLAELTELKDQHAQALQQLEKIKMELHHLPPHIIMETPEYKGIQSKFTVLFKEAEKIRDHAEQLRTQLKDTKTAHLKQIEQIEGEELLAQKQLRLEMIQLEDQLSQVRREYEMLRLEFEQNLAANEQSGPVNKEMRQLLQSYKTQNQQLKSEVARFKKKWRDSISLIAKAQKELDAERKQKENQIIIDMGKPEEDERPESPLLDEESEPEPTDIPGYKTLIKKYRAKLTQLKAELQAFASLTTEEKELAAVIASEKVLKQENRKLRKEMGRFGCMDKREKHKYYNEEALKRIKLLEEHTEKLKKEATSSKSEEDTLLNEMEVTGQAFEEVQEQNSRLIQQLKEKDDANFKLMSERIRSNQQQKKLKEEKDLIEEQVGALSNQVEAQNLLIRKLEEKERVFQQSLSTLEKELALRVQAVDLTKRKALEYGQTAADLKLQVEKLSSQLSDAQLAVATKTSSLEEESFKIRRMQEDIAIMRRRLERSKEFEKVEDADEVLLEEIRELKEQLTCPSCKVHPKNAILTKCYHVFCWECLKTRYDTRRRKCPKCNAAFGANDYRRIYIA